LRGLRGTKQPKQSIDIQHAGLLRLTARNDDIIELTQHYLCAVFKKKVKGKKVNGEKEY